MRAFTDVRQVVAMLAVGTPFDAALATPGVAKLKQSRPAARSFRLVVHASIGPPGVTPDFDFIVRLLGYGDLLLGKCVKSEMEPSRNDRIRGCNGSPGGRFNQFMRRLSGLNLRTISFTQRIGSTPLRHQIGRSLVERIAVQNSARASQGGSCP